MMEFSVIIPTLNRPNDLKITLNSLLNQTLLPKEVIVIDQSDSNSTKLLIDIFSNNNKNINFIYKKNQIKSSTKARNTGMNLAKHEIITFLDDDVELSENYLKEIKKIFEEKKAVLVGGKIERINYTSLRKKLGEIYKKLFYLSRQEKNRYDVQVSFNSTYCFEFKKILSTQWASGSNHSVLKKVAQEMKFDEQLIRYAYAEDLDFTYRIYKRYPNGVYITPRAKLKHFVTPEARLPNRSRIYMDAVHKRYLFKKNIKQTFKNNLIFYWSRLGRTLLAFISLLRKPDWERLVNVNNLIKAELYAFKNKKYIDDKDLRFFHRWLNMQ